MLSGGRLLSRLSGVKNVKESNGCCGIIRVATRLVLTPTGQQNIIPDSYVYWKRVRLVESGLTKRLKGNVASVGEQLLHFHHLFLLPPLWTLFRL